MTTKVSVCRVDGFNVDVDGKTADQALRMSETFQQLNRGLEIVAAAPQGQVVYFAGGHSRIISSMASTLRMRHLPRCSSGGSEDDGLACGVRTSRIWGAPKDVKAIYIFGPSDIEGMAPAHANAKPPEWLGFG